MHQLPQPQPLFDVIGFTFDQDNNVITAHLDDNNYYSNDVIIDGNLFNEWLDAYDLLYYETNAIIRGELKNVCDIITMAEFIEYSDYTHMCNELYQYLISLMKKS